MVTSTSRSAFTHPSKDTQERAVDVTTMLLRDAYALGVMQAQTDLMARKGMKRSSGEKNKESLGDFLKTVKEHAAYVVSSFLIRIQSWWSDHKDDDPDELPDEFESFVTSSSEGAAQYEVASALMAGTMETFIEADVPEVEWIASPDSCDMCLVNQAAGPIPIGSEFPGKVTAPPQHGRCGCGLLPVEE